MSFDELFRDDICLYYSYEYGQWANWGNEQYFKIKLDSPDNEKIFITKDGLNYHQYCYEDGFQGFDFKQMLIEIDKNHVIKLKFIEKYNLNEIKQYVNDKAFIEYEKKDKLNKWSKDYLFIQRDMIQPDFRIMHGMDENIKFQENNIIYNWLIINDK